MRLLIATSAFSNEDLLLKCVTSWPHHPLVGGAVYFDGLNYNMEFLHKDKIPDFIEQIKPESLHRGCAGSWNKLLEYWIHKTDADYILIVGSDTVLTSLFDIEVVLTELDAAKPDLCFIPTIEFNAFFISRKGVETIGQFDENFFPAYFEDNDYLRRFILTPSLVIAEILDASIIHHEGSQTIRKNPVFQAASHKTFVMNRDRYIAKWGGDPDKEGKHGSETFTHPYNDMTKDVNTWDIDRDEYQKKFDIWNCHTDL